MFCCGLKFHQYSLNMTLIFSHETGYICTNLLLIFQRICVIYYRCLKICNYFLCWFNVTFIQSVLRIRESYMWVFLVFYFLCFKNHFRLDWMLGPKKLLHSILMWSWALLSLIMKLFLYSMLCEMPLQIYLIIGGPLSLTWFSSAI